MLKALKDLLEVAEEILGELNSERRNDGWEEWDDSDTPAMVKARAIVQSANSREATEAALQLAYEWLTGQHGEPGEIGAKSLEEIESAIAQTKEIA